MSSFLLLLPFLFLLFPLIVLFVRNRTLQMNKYIGQNKAICIISSGFDAKAPWSPSQNNNNKTKKPNKTEGQLYESINALNCLCGSVMSWAHCEREWPSRHVWSLLWQCWLSCPGNRQIILSGFVPFYGVRLDHTCSALSANLCRL